MGPRRNRRKDDYDDWEDSGTVEGFTNGSDYHSEIPVAGAAGERGIVNGNEHMNGQNSSSQYRQVKENGPVQPKHEATLGPWTQAVRDVNNEMSSTQRAIRNLQEIFAIHQEDLEMLNRNKIRLAQREEECRQKDVEIERQEITISTLRSSDEKAKANIQIEQDKIKKEKQELMEDKSKLSKRIEVATEERKHSLEREFRERTTKHDNIHELRMKALEAEFARKSVEQSTIAKSLKLENEGLSTKVQQQEAKIEAQAKELDTAKQDCDVLNRAQDSFRNEIQALKGELGKMKEEFALNTKPAAHFSHQFAEIYGRVESISVKYFHDTEDKDLDRVHNQLAEADPHFKSVPIDESPDSRDLQMAHAQRIISKALFEDVWQPFCSELTLPHPKFSDLLSEIAENLERSSHNGRVGDVWTALTVRALESLHADRLPAVPVPDPKQQRPPASSQEDSVISKVLGVLSPLVSPSKLDSLRTELRALVKSSVNVWNDAQSGGSRITMTLSLDGANREEWRAQQFDPILPSRDGDEPSPDQVSKTRPRIFTLFPRILTRCQDDQILPGSWPTTQLAVLYPGIGLPESSSLVIRGKIEQKEREEFMEKALENAKRELNSTKRGSGSGRRESRGSMTSGPPSPTSQWRMEGAMKFVEK